MKLAHTKLMLVDELLTDEAFCRSTINKCRHWRAFHSGVVGKGDPQGVLLGEEHIVGE